MNKLKLVNELTQEEVDDMSRQPKEPVLRKPIDAVKDVVIMGVGGAMAALEAAKNLKVKQNVRTVM